MHQKQAPVWWLIILLGIIKFALPFLLQSHVFELQRDEYLYYLQGQHLALGYLENPPLISYLGAISSWFGGTEFSIMFWPAWYGALTVIVTCMITAELGGKMFAQLLAGLAVMTGAFLRVHALFQPNMLDIFFWTLSIYFLIRFIHKATNYHLYAMAISFSLGFWSKYSIVFIAAALLISLLITSRRKILFQKKIFIAALVALIIILPNIYWQYAHNWPLVHHMKELRETQLQYVDPKDFIKDQFMMTLSAVFVWVAGLIWVFKNPAYRFLGFTYLFVIALLMLGSGKSYYSLGIYPVLFATGAVAWQQWTLKIKWLRSVFIVFIIGFTALILPVALATKEPAKLAAFYKRHNIKHKWEDQQEHPLPQDFADMLGWKELATKSESFFNGLPDSVKKDVVTYCRNYGQAGALQFYAKEKNFKNSVISDNGSFLLWIPEGLHFKHLLLIGHDMPGKDDEVFQHFEKATIIDSVTNVYSRQLGDKIIFFQNADAQANKIANNGLNESRKVFLR